MLDLLFGAFAVATLACAWLAVQLAWGRSFGVAPGADRMEARGDCLGCSREGHCHTTSARKEAHGE